MQSTPPRPSRRALRTACPRCDRVMEFQRMREHLREVHQMESAELDTVLLIARRDAIRGPVRSRA